VLASSGCYECQRDSDCAPDAECGFGNRLPGTGFPNPIWLSSSCDPVAGAAEVYPGELWEPCRDTPMCADGEPCPDDDDACNEGLTCSDGTCVPAEDAGPDSGADSGPDAGQ
jgi:hypothetical protein